MLNWSASNEEEFSSYKVTRTTSSSGPFDVVEVISDVNQTSFTDSGLIFGNTYHYQIVVVVNNGDESKSNTKTSIFEGENIDLGVNIVQMLVDPSRPYIYALDQINDSLLFINKDGK